MLQKPAVDQVKLGCEEYCAWLLRIAECTDFKPEML